MKMSRANNKEKYKEYDHNYYIKNKRPKSKIGQAELKIADLEHRLALTEKALEIACNEQDLYWFSKYADRDGVDLVEWLKNYAKEISNEENNS